MEPPRKSRRLRKGSQPIPCDTQKDNSASDPEETPGPQIESDELGTTKATQTRVKKRGLLAAVAEFPLDVLFEVIIIPWLFLMFVVMTLFLWQIFKYMTPYDLLRLSRATKGLRQVLLQKSSRFIWEAARSNLEGLPDKPSDLSEPRYASLVFDSHCDVSLLAIGLRLSY